MHKLEKNLKLFFGIHPFNKTKTIESDFWTHASWASRQPKMKEIGAYFSCLDIIAVSWRLTNWVYRRLCSVTPPCLHIQRSDTRPITLGSWSAPIKGVSLWLFSFYFFFFWEKKKLLKVISKKLNVRERRSAALAAW